MPSFDNKVIDGKSLYSILGETNKYIDTKVKRVMNATPENIAIFSPFTPGEILDSGVKLSEIEGAVGPKGDTGLNHLTFNGVLIMNTPPVISTWYELTFDKFSRTPVVGDVGTGSISVRNSTDTMIVTFKVTTVDVDKCEIDITGLMLTTGMMGPQGADGIIGRNSLFIVSTHEVSMVPIVDTIITIPLTKFNLPPDVNDFGTGILTNNSSSVERSFLIIFKVTTVTTTNATIVVTGMTETTGMQGVQGLPGAVVTLQTGTNIVPSIYSVSDTENSFLHHINFPQSFTAIPTVHFNIISNYQMTFGAHEYGLIQVFNITKTGFDVRHRSNDNLTITWLAIV